MKHSTVSALLGAASVLAIATAAAAETAPGELDQVVVTGTRALGRTVENSPAPIDVLSGVELQHSNQTNLLDTLNTLLPSFNLPTVGTPDIGSMVRAGQLRGLSPDQTLVLVDGKRRHSTAFLGAGGFSASTPADLALIPSAAIDHVEVLRDGASALYGSDAIAGVINIITKSSSHGGGLSLEGGQFYAGDGQTGIAKADFGTTLGPKGSLHLAGEVDHQNGVVRNFPVPSNYLYYFPLNAQGKQVATGPNNTLPAGATPDPREATRDPVAWKNTGAPAYTIGALSEDAKLQLNDKVEAYSFATFSYRRADSPQNFRTPTRDTDVAAIYPDGFAPIEQIKEKDGEASLGLRGDDLAGWHWDLSTDYGRDTVDAYTRNSLNATLGASSPTSFYDGELKYGSWTNNLDLRRSIGGILAAPIDVSLGAEYRRETYSISPGEYASYIDGGVGVLTGPNAGKSLVGNGGAQGLPGFRPEDAVDASRESYSAYLGLAAHLTPKLLIDLAGRYEHYSDFGGKVTGRATARYDFTDWLAIRGTISNGFHAPALAVENYKNTANINTYEQHTLQVNSAAAKALGATPLKPETSTNYSVGFVTEPIKRLHVDVDAYEIDIDNRIAQSTSIRDAIYPGTGVLVQAAGFSAADGVSYFINAVNTRSQGIDVTADTTTDFGDLGRVVWTVGLNFNKTKATQIAQTPAILQKYNVPIFSAANLSTLTYEGPRSKEIISANWIKGPWSISVRESHYGRIKRQGTPTTVATSGPYAGQTSIEEDVAPIFTTDLNIDFKIRSNITLSAIANNLFDARPSKVPAPLLAANQTASYINFGPVGSAGGFWALKVAYTFQ